MLGKWKKKVVFMVAESIDPTDLASILGKIDDQGIGEFGVIVDRLDSLVHCKLVQWRELNGFMTVIEVQNHHIICSEDANPIPRLGSELPYYHCFYVLITSYVNRVLTDTYTGATSRICCGRHYQPDGFAAWVASEKYAHIVK